MARVRAGEQRWWRPLILGGAVLWIGTVILIASRSEPESDAVRLTLAIGGFVYFTLVIVLSAYAGGGPRSVGPLLRELAITADLDALDRAADAARSRIGLVYRTGSVALVALLFGFLAVGEERMAPYFIGAMILVALLLVGYYLLVAKGRASAAASDYARLLGLELTSVPSYVRTPGLYGGFDGGGLVGAMEYAGRRHGSPVVVVQTATEAVTSVGLTSELPVLAQLSDPERFAAETGLGAEVWPGVTATWHGPGQVVVVRLRTGAGAFMLHDLKLAERLAQSR